MSICINPQCPNPQNPDSVQFCQSCGSELLFLGRYRAIREMGKGGFAKTFEVSDGGTHKVLKMLLLGDPKAVSLFQQEARVLAQFDRPGIPKGEGYFTYMPRNAREPLHCLVMEYIEGEDLVEWFKNRDFHPIDQQQAIQWLKELAAILHRVHQQNFFHRDIKPSNIMLTPNSGLVLIDFGAAREVTETYLDKMSGGENVTGIISAGYTAPEQAIGKAVPQSDFFSLGRTFVYLLTGKAPTAFKEDPKTGQLLWRESAPQVSAPLADFIDQLTGLLPGSRPQSTGDLLQRLAQFDDGSITRPGTQPGSSGQLSQVGTVAASPQQKNKTQSNTNQAQADLPPYTKWVIGAAILVLGWVGFEIYSQERSPLTQQPPTSTTPAPTPTPQPTTQPTASPTAQPTSQPIPKPTSQPRPQPTSQPTPQPTTQPTPKPTPQPTPQPRPEPTPQPTTQPAPKPTPQPIPKPTAQPAPKPTTQPVPQPVSTPRPQPTPPPNASSGAGSVATIKAHKKPVYSVAIAGNGGVIASGGGDNDIRLWNASSGERVNSLSRHIGPVLSVAISPDGQTLASGSADSKIMLWNARNGALRRTLTAHRDQVHAVAFSADGQTLASGSGGIGGDFRVLLWDASSGQVRQTLTGHTDRVLTIAFSPDGNAIATGSAEKDQTIKIWDANTGQILQTLEGSSSYINSVAFSADGNILASTDSNRIQLWDIARGDRIRQIKGHTRKVNAIAISPDGRLLASASDDRAVKLWDLATGKELDTLEGHRGRVRSVAFSADGQTIVSGGEDGTIKVWQAP